MSGTSPRPDAQAIHHVSSPDSEHSIASTYLRPGAGATASQQSLPYLPRDDGIGTPTLDLSQCAVFARKLREINSDRGIFKSRRDEILNDRFFQWKTFDPADQDRIYNPYRNPNVADGVNTLECWDYENTDGIGQDQYVRILEAGHVRQFGFEDNEDPIRFDERFGRWLQKEAEFEPLKPDDAGALNGGLRLAFCERPLMDLGMTIRRDIFEAIESNFELHDATLPAFADKGGCFSLFTQRDDSGGLCKLQIVIKAVQKVEITNCLLSLTHDVRTSWTNAFACGDSLVRGQPSDALYGSQGDQLLDACACCGKHLWKNPLLLPLALLQMCTRRALKRTETLEDRLLDVERALGVVTSGWVSNRRPRPDWPMDIDIKRETRELHSTLPQILFLRAVVQWQKRYAAWLLRTTSELQLEAVFADQRSTFEEIRATIQLLASSIDGMLEFFAGMEGRTQSQINLLFSVVSQRDAINSQKANTLNYTVARSTKEDSISMTTFTFITALFLPLTFIATLFSMDMFDWSAGSGEENARVLSKRFWIFWVIALPLTILTLCGWYGWYGHANRAWQRQLDLQNGSCAMSPEDDDSSLQNRDRIHQMRRRRMHAENEHATLPVEQTDRDTSSQHRSRAPLKWIPKPFARTEKHEAV